MNAASEGARKLLAVHDELKARQHSGDLVAVMGTPEGRRFVWQLISDAGVFKTSFVASDPSATAFNEGQRARGLAILARLQDEAPDLYLKAQSEHVESEKRAQELREAAEAEAATEQKEENE